MNYCSLPGKLPKYKFQKSKFQIPKYYQKEVIPQPAEGSIWNLGFEYWDFSKILIKFQIL